MQVQYIKAERRVAARLQQVSHPLSQPQPKTSLIPGQEEENEKDDDDDEEEEEEEEEEHKGKPSSNPS
ncbi:hypothetical protein E2C01_078131 [Portunus trituberculatus]|uniref:Uncharacterized protein n=1 Tax=Portunus trituberculatus TaxID=210409 RepID=A0A5B7IHX8_PORTR|nr:hypothetical protein [Portunus trituberculatus]